MMWLFSARSVWRSDNNPTVLVLGAWKVLIQAPLQYVGICRSHERREREVSGKQVSFQRSFLCPLRSVGPLSQWTCSWEGQDPHSVPLLWQARSSDGFLCHSSKRSLSRQWSCCFPLCWHMLCYVACHSLFYIKIFLNSSAPFCWKRIMAASYWWKPLLRAIKPFPILKDKFGHLINLGECAHPWLGK